MDHQHLCAKCKALTLDDFEDGYLHSLVSYLLNQEDKNIGPCSLCALLLWSLRFDKTYLRNNSEDEVHLFLNPPPKHTYAKLQCIDVIVSSRTVSGFGWGPRGYDEPWHVGPPDSRYDIRRGRLTIYSERGSVNEANFKYRPLLENSQSAACFSLAKQWLDNCLQNHGSACQSGAKKLPTRLIDVGDSSMLPRLVITSQQYLPDPESTRYVALSYCWGRSTFLTTTSSNIGDFMTSIPWETIPKTIQDAIIVTRELGVQYLWADAFCILQGHDDAAYSDWQKESTNMHHIYQGACLTLSAAHGAHANEGLFHQRKIEPVQPCALQRSPKYPVKILVGPEPPHLLPHLEPLNTRAWTLQERLLSNRILSYGTAGLRWMCHQSLHHETAPKLGHQGFCIMETSNPGVESATVKRLQKDSPQWMLTEWKTIVEHFTQRNLTYITDKLPALSGLAQMAQNSCKDTYLAGLWLSELPQQLMWVHRGKRTQLGTTYNRQSQYRAPSWTWASVDGRVEFLHGYESLPEIVTTCSLTIEDTQHPRAMQKQPLKIFGVMRTLPSIRYEHSAKYYGGAEPVTDWISYSDALRTYLDDLKALPESQVRDTPDSPRMLLRPVLLFLGSKMVSEGASISGAFLDVSSYTINHLCSGSSAVCLLFSVVREE
ncbi:HET-domain-containing protein [Lindgomyces ingoldianus]|uniref:HET-domain-containing protein n=1 Tax=Lindgomyces ingoldianus TaxID=673940 RepID=A0ACB6RCT3_9PLEO|nr:HET-domain-containing protein [Lindgomyces ingoldianus]KAF2476951.1 HET-domain-containing protein [Lindgomyces ingoldianus]